MRPIFIVLVVCLAWRALGHCQVPCGIYDDASRLGRLETAVQTIGKAVASLGGEHATAQELNQMVRWVNTKEEHAQFIMDELAGYWLAQRMTPPVDAGQAQQTDYVDRLLALHHLVKQAMRCKQTADAAEVQLLQQRLDTFSAFFTQPHIKT